MSTLMKKLLAYSLTTFLAVLLVITIFSQPCAAYFYWANSNNNTIGRANLDGSSSNQNWITGCNRPGGVAIDANHIYWANNNNNTIGRANLDGSSSNQNWITGCDNPYGVVVDADHICWANIDKNTIGRANLDGSSSNQSWITGCNAPFGIASAPDAPPPIPTLNEWGLILFCLLLLGWTVYIKRKRREIRP